MKCGGCNSNLAARVRVRVISGKLVESCDICANEPSVWLPDVYLESGGGIHTNESLWNRQENKPFEYATKREKAAIMKMLNVSEAGDSSHGARNESYRRRKYI